MKRLWLVGLLALIASVALAQDAPVLLQYKFEPGRVDLYDVKMTGVLPMMINPGPEAEIPMMAFDVNLDMSMTIRHVCRSVAADGSAQIEMTFPQMMTQTRIEVEGQPIDMVMRWENGQLTNTLNGQPQPLDENTQKMVEGLKATYSFTMKPNGEQVLDPQTTQLMNQLYQTNAFGGMDMSRLSALTSRLPDAPVAPGDTWEVADEVTSQQMTMSGQSQMKLAGYEDFEGKRVARIEGSATTAMNGQMDGGAGFMGASFNITKMEININFINRFDPAAGVMPLSMASAAQNMAMMLSMAGMGQGQAIHLPMSMDNGQFTMEMRLQ